LRGNVFPLKYLKEVRLDADKPKRRKGNSHFLLTISKGARKLLLDMDSVEYISSAGLRVLLAVAKKLKKEEGEIKLCCLKPYVKEVFDIAGFTQIFKVHDTTEEAIQGF